MWGEPIISISFKVGIKIIEKINKIQIFTLIGLRWKLYNFQAYELLKFESKFGGPLLSF